jgi:hypothetical protein
MDDQLVPRVHVTLNLFREVAFHPALVCQARGRLQLRTAAHLQG